MKNKYYSLIPITLAVLFVFAVLIFTNDSDSRSKHLYADATWEEIPTPDSSARVIRTRVPQGWLVMYKTLARTMVYIPDEKHEWNLKREK